MANTVHNTLLLPISMNGNPFLPHLAPVIKQLMCHPVLCVLRCCQAQAESQQEEVQPILCVYKRQILAAHSRYLADMWLYVILGVAVILFILKSWLGSRGPNPLAKDTRRPPGPVAFDKAAKRKVIKNGKDNQEGQSFNLNESFYLCYVLLSRS